MASGPITSWEIDGETVETVSDLFWGAPKSLQMVTAALPKETKHLYIENYKTLVKEIKEDTNRW